MFPRHPLLLLLGTSTAFRLPTWVGTTDTIVLPRAAVPTVPTSLPFQLPLDLPRPAPPAVDVQPLPEDDTPFAIASAVSLIARAVGHIGLAVAVAAAIGIFGVGIPAAQAFNLVTGWLTAEGLFYLACLGFASRMHPASRASSPSGALTTEWRSSVWSRIINDPTLNARNFCEQWFYSTSYGHGNALTALLGWARSLIGLPPSKPPPKVKYEQLRLADVMHWLSGGLFEKRLHELTSAERVELRGLVSQLEKAAGAPLLDQGDDTTPTSGIRPMRLMLDDLQWLHRPLVYYFLTQVLWGGLMTPMMFAAKGFGKDECDGLTYYIKAPHEEKEKKAQPSKASSPSLGAQLAKQLRLGEEADDTSTTTATAKSGSTSSSGGGNLAAILASSTLTAMAEEAKGVVVSAATEAKGAVATLAEEAKAVMPMAEPTRQATVFIHGVGVGAGPYINLIDEIANRKEGGGYDSSSSIACPATAAANANAANEGSSGGIGGGPC